MKHLSEEEQEEIKMYEMRKSVPSLITTLKDLTANPNHQTDEEKVISKLALDVLTQLGTEYTDEELVASWETAQEILSRLPRWGNYW
tara:strand:+ start:516 stop:776 length:261 start_codon:yes stop_codon:yes gene_type:complete